MIDTPGEFVPAFIAAWMARDGTALAALFAEDADFVNVTGLWWRDRAAIARAHQYALDSFFSGTILTAGALTIRDLGHVAVVHARMHLTGQRAPDGSIAGDRRTVFTFVLSRGVDGWLCVAAQNTDVVPGKETHVAEDGGLTAHDYRHD